ncbi:hypothetical protein [Aliiglaciecola lipolytica]|uniref:AraC family transcriptional regulator n=1 Tax=Aliiglaciecola lipolytica E3 TaxID=1127673 RepID=K6YWC7_9ALTE|nr:hypothetical protein [Aliiglaciecola lipolytica]GAC15555.1 conserved hypothetical protein, secreted [Aliiglaciecola lipolytica E3]
MNMSTFIAALLLLSVAFQSSAQQSADTDQQTVAKQLQQLRKEVIALNRDLFVLEEDLLFPSSTQVVVYLSVDVGTYFKLDSVELKIDDKVVTEFLYTDRQVDALYRGGVQRLHIGNLAQGDHQISAFFIGLGPEGREYKRAATFNFKKEADAKALELKISDSSVKQQPEFTVVEL